MEDKYRQELTGERTTATMSAGGTTTNRSSAMHGAAIEKRLFAAIREVNKLDAEIDDEYRRLASAEYDEPGPSENPA